MYMASRVGLVVGCMLFIATNGCVSSGPHRMYSDSVPTNAGLSAGAAPGNACAPPDWDIPRGDWGDCRLELARLRKRVAILEEECYDLGVALTRHGFRDLRECLCTTRPTQ